MIVLPDAEYRTIISSLVWTKTPERDGQTNYATQTCYYSGLYYEQCGRAVIIEQLRNAEFLIDVASSRYFADNQFADKTFR